MLNVSEKYKNELPQVMLDFLDYLDTKRKSNHTITNYANDLRKWFNFQFNGDLATTEKEISELKLRDLDRFQASVRDLSVNTVLRYIASIKSFYNYLAKYELITNNIAIHIESPKKEIREPKFLTEKEVVKLLNSVNEKNGRYVERDLAILSLFVTTGLRLSEVANIKKSDIKDGRLSVIGKGNKERSFPLMKDTMSVIRKYLKTRDDNVDTLFITERKQGFNEVALTHLVKKYLTKIGRGDLSTHKLRHTFATMHIENGTNILDVQKMLGHSNVATTQIYAHNNNDLKDVVNNINIKCSR